jgi:hypothetical protein
MALTPLPTPPSRDDPANFAARGDAFLGALPTFADELNAELPTINEAIPASEIAVALVNYKGDYSASTTYLVGQSVTYNDVRFLSKKTNLNITPVDGADWYELASGAETVVRSILNQSSAITLLASDGGGYLLVSGTTKINLNLPDATTLVGRTFVIKNLGTYPMFVYNAAGTYLFNLNGNQTSVIWASDISTSAGEWSIQEFPAPYADSTLIFGPITAPNVNSLQPVARLSSTKQLVVFNQQASESNKVYGVIATNSAGTITVGAPQLISNIDGTGVAAVGLSGSSAIVSWKASSGAWNACAVSIASDIITAGTEIVIASAINDKIKFAFLTSTTALIAGYPTIDTLSAAVLTVSGTTLTSGGLADIGGGNTPDANAAYGLCTLSSTLCMLAFAGSGNHLIKTISISGLTVTQNAHYNTGISSGNKNVALASYSATSATYVYISTSSTDLRVGRVSVSGTTPTLISATAVVVNAIYGTNTTLGCNVIHRTNLSGYIYGLIATTAGDRIYGFTLAVSTYTIGTALSPSTGSSPTTAFRQLENFSDPTAGTESSTYTTFHHPLTIGNLQSLTLSGTTASAGTRVGVGPRYVLQNSSRQVSAISTTRAIALVPKWINGVAIGLYAHLIDYSNAPPSIIATQVLTSELPTLGSYSSVSLSSTQVLLTWNQSSYDIRSAVLTITGDTLSLGSDVLVDAGDGGASGNYWHSITKLSATTALFTWAYRSSLLPRSVVLSVSGTTVSVGTGVNLQAATSSQERTDCIALSPTLAVVAYNLSQPYIALLSISGTTITIQQNFRSYIGDSRPTLTSLSSTKFIVSDGNSSSGALSSARVGVVANSQITMYPFVKLPSRYGALRFVATSENRGFAYDDEIDMAYAFTINSDNQIVIDKTATFDSPWSGSLLQTNAVVPNGSTFAYIGYDDYKAFTGKIHSLGAIK